MKKLLQSLAAGLACLALMLTSSPAFADGIAMSRNAGTVIQFGTVDATASYTNATTSATDIAAATLTIPATTRPIVGTQASATGKAQYIRACYTADVGKATTATGTITLLISGVSYAAAARTIDVGRGTLQACAYVARATKAAVIVKLQGVSGDTAVLTVYNANLTVEVVYFS